MKQAAMLLTLILSLIIAVPAQAIWNDQDLLVMRRQEAGFFLLCPYGVVRGVVAPKSYKSCSVSTQRISKIEVKYERNDYVVELTTSHHVERVVLLPWAFHFYNADGELAIEYLKPNHTKEYVSIGDIVMGQFRLYTNIKFKYLAEDGQAYLYLMTK